MATITDFHAWLEAASVDDANELYSLYKCVEEGDNSGIFKSVSSNDGKLFIRVGHVSDQLMIASEKAKEHFLKILENVSIDNACIKDFPDADSWHDYLRAWNKED